MADTLPVLAELLREMPPCFCQPGPAETIAVPADGTYLVQHGRAVPAPDPVPDLPITDLITQTIRDMYEYAARVLANAPPGIELEIRLSSDGAHEARLLGTYVFTRTQEAGDG
jgi:hypothetical protein